ncbi:MAG TPA: VOC family protein [Myxococcales bacterium]|nr:VOC family protein [Myxococcales bacterium]
MAIRISRRTMLVAAGALAVPARAAPAVPSSFDHVMLGCGDLDQGIDFVEHHVGVRAAMGGVHPGRGSRNALLSFGDRRYLEIIGPDPAQPRSSDARELYKIESPRLIGWAAHVDDMDALARKLTDAKIEFKPPTPGSRKRPSGQLLRWKLLFLRDDQGGLLPFFIEWDKESPHPAIDAPGGCRLERFELVSPQPDALRATVSRLQLDVGVVQGAQPAIRAKLTGPKGSLSLPG